MKQDFPLNGVIGIIANHPNELDLALESGLQCVEVRADLLLDAGISLNQILELIQDAQLKGLASLMTLRHPSHGGTFSGTEDERVQINQKALEAGVDLIDLEWASDASEAMVQKQAPMVISHHDFEGMLSEEELNDLTGKMEALAPRAIKVVPSAKSLSHSFQMLNWVSDAKPEISRIGFAMGVYGTSSRILTTVFGAPITYASFGAAVAPGQLSMSELQKLFNIQDLNREAQIYAYAGKEANSSPQLESMNRKLKMQNHNAVCVPLETDDLDELMAITEKISFAGIQLASPLKELYEKQLAQSKPLPTPSLFQDF